MFILIVSRSSILVQNTNIELFIKIKKLTGLILKQILVNKVQYLFFLIHNPMIIQYLINWLIRLFHVKL